MSTQPSYQRPASQTLQPQQQQAQHEEEEEEFEESSYRFLRFNVMPSWMVSFITHVGIIILLALLWLPTMKEELIGVEVGDTVDNNLENVDVNFEEMPTEDAMEMAEASELSESDLIEDVQPEALAEQMDEIGDFLAGEESSFEMDSFSEMKNLSSNETSGRGKDAREAQIRKYGGSAASETAVELALEWLAKHQLEDGSWSLNHTVGPGKDRDKNNPGERDAANGATALALLPFLGHGDTHKSGKYKKTVRAGLKYLMNSANAHGRGLSWHEPGGTMYSHGLVSIVLCEAYAMTEDSELGPFAQGSLWFIEDAQHRAGGWRYGIQNDPGDTSAVGWQLMALKSGKLGGLDYNLQTIKLAEKFLDSVSIGNGACYGYLDPPKRNKDGSFPQFRKGVTSVGLLCRMYMGWGRDNKGLADGIEFMRKMGPSVGTQQDPQRVNMYYNYYATQAMKHWGGSEWEEWNKVMRDFLVESQETEGTKRGSWFWNAKNHSSKGGGRLYHTALATMTLEVYYRYLPLYGDAASEDEFPLD